MGKFNKEFLILSGLIVENEHTPQEVDEFWNNLPQNLEELRAANRKSLNNFLISLCEKVLPFWEELHNKSASRYKNEPRMLLDRLKSDKSVLDSRLSNISNALRIQRQFNKTAYHAITSIYYLARFFYYNEEHIHHANMLVNEVKNTGELSQEQIYEEYKRFANFAKMKNTHNIQPEHISSTVKNLAKAAYVSGNPVSHEITMKIADALQDSGYDNQEVLQHLIKHPIYSKDWIFDILLTPAEKGMAVMNNMSNIFNKSKD